MELPPEVDERYERMAREREWPPEMKIAFLESVAWIRGLDEGAASRSYYRPVLVTADDEVTQPDVGAAPRLRDRGLRPAEDPRPRWAAHRRARARESIAGARLSDLWPYNEASLRRCLIPPALAASPDLGPPSLRKPARRVR
jgi:hypothetical protein